MAGVNLGFLSACESPFGSVYESAHGREAGRHEIQQYLALESMLAKHSKLATVRTKGLRAWNGTALPVRTSPSLIQLQVPLEAVLLSNPLDSDVPFGREFCS